jgi:hypothetical protein
MAGPTKRRRVTAAVESPTNDRKISRSRRFLRTVFRLTGNPLAAVPREEIVRTGRLIRELAAHLRTGSVRADRLYFRDDRTIDLAATAFANGINVAALDDLLVRRQHESARAAWLAFGLGWVFFVLFLLRATAAALTVSHLMPLLEFLPFCVVFFLLAFRSGLRNFQLRERRLATAAEYLTASQGFWPH